MLKYCNLNRLNDTDYNQATRLGAQNYRLAWLLRKSSEFLNITESTETLEDLGSSVTSPRTSWATGEAA